MELHLKSEINEREKMLVNEIIDGEYSIISSKSTLRQCSEEEIKGVAQNAKCFDDDYKNKLFQTLLEFRSIFSDEPGIMKAYQYEIIMRDSWPFFIKSYTIPHVY